MADPHGVGVDYKEDAQRTFWGIPHLQKHLGGIPGCPNFLEHWIPIGLVEPHSAQGNIPQGFQKIGPPPLGGGDRILGNTPKGFGIMSF